MHRVSQYVDTQCIAYPTTTTIGACGIQINNNHAMYSVNLNIIMKLGFIET